VTAAHGLLRRALKNMALLLTGKGMSGAMQLASFALIARGLGPVEFGFFALLQTHVTLLSGLMTVQSNQAIIHFGVKHLETGDKGKFQALIKAGTLVDVGGALLASILAALLAPVLADFLHWDDRIVSYAQAFAPVALASAIATPKGILRLFGHFGVLAQQTVITPALRLIGSALVFAFDAPLPYYLAAWMFAAFVGSAVMIWQAWTRAAAKGLISGFDPSLRNLGRGSPGLWRFMMVTNIYSTLALVPNHLATYLVGGMLGPAAAGQFKVAREVATALGKPADLLNQTLYPDLARLALAKDWRQLLLAILRAAGMAFLLGLLFLVLILGWGDALIAAVFGKEFIDAAPILSLLVAATALAMTVFPAEPALYALGRPGVLLQISVASNLLLFALMVTLMGRFGLVGAGWAAIASTSLGALLLAASTLLALRAPADPTPPPKALP